MKYDKAGIVFRLICCFLCFLMLSGCTYDVPEGYLTQHHSYASALEYARSIDPEATVSENHVDLEDEYGDEYRQWEAVIFGRKCHVASCRRTVYQSGSGLESSKAFYAMDTDFDYQLLEILIRENQPQWELWEDNLSAWYQKQDVLIVHIPTSGQQALTVEELDRIWESAQQIAGDYAGQDLRKTVSFALQAPIKVYDSAIRAYEKVMCWIPFSDFSEAGKEAYIAKYSNYWRLAEETQ